jgi:hypothetical protein
MPLRYAFRVLRPNPNLFPHPFNPRTTPSKRIRRIVCAAKPRSELKAGNFPQADRYKPASVSALGIVKKGPLEVDRNWFIERKLQHERRLNLVLFPLR